MFHLLEATDSAHSRFQSLMNFILPDQFTEHMESMRAIFKVKGDSKVTMLSQERVSRAKKMMTPFVLRRRKDQVRVSPLLFYQRTHVSPGFEGPAEEDGEN